MHFPSPALSTVVLKVNNSTKQMSSFILHQRKGTLESHVSGVCGQAGAEASEGHTEGLSSNPDSLSHDP